MSMRRLIYVGLAGMLFLTACNTPEPLDFSFIADSAEENAELENEFASVFDMVDNIAVEDPEIAGKRAYTILSDCAEAIYNNQTRILDINFGDTNCLCKDGLYRRGRLRATFTGNYRTAGTKVTITLQDYFTQGVEFRGIKTIENLGDSAGIFRYRYEVKDGKAITDDGTVNWNTVSIVHRVQGNGTITPWDDVYTIRTTSDGMTRKGVSYTVRTLEPLLRKIEIGCMRNFIDGVLEMETDEGNTLEVDYDPIGGAMCDKTAEVTINGGNPRLIQLR